MSDDVKKDVTLSLNVMIHKEKAKVLFAEADSHFVDILLSFLTLPLGRIIKVLDSGDEAEAATMGSLSTLYRSLANLDSSHFVTKGAKEALLNPKSSFEAEYEMLKLDVSDSPPAEYFDCTNKFCQNEFLRSVSIYYDRLNYCRFCGRYGPVSKKVVAQKSFEAAAASSDGVFTLHKDSFIISDDLQILPNEKGILGIIAILGIADMDEAEIIKVDLGLSEITKLLKASLTSPTPLSDLIMNKTQEMNINSRMMEPNISLPENIAKEENPKSRKLSLKVMIQKSSGKFLYAQANEEFVEFLFSCLHIPLGGVEHLLSGKACVTAIDNLYRSTLDVIDDKYFKRNMKERLTKPNVVHGCISEDHILPLVEEPLPPAYAYILLNDLFSSAKFPNGRGNYLQGPRTYEVNDDLTVVPFCIVSIYSGLRAKRISISDVQEVEMQIGLKEACSILKASLTSNTALTDALLSHKSFEQPQREEV